MKSIRIVLFAIVVSSPFLLAESSELSAGARDDFVWFDGLGYPDVKDAPWVEVWTGRYEGSVPPRAMTTSGFLLRSGEGHFSVVKLDLRNLNLTETNPDTEAFRRVGFEKRPFRKMAEDFLTGLSTKDEDPNARIHRQFGLWLGLRAQTFVLAWACWRKGEDALAQDLYDAAKGVEPWRISEEETNGESLRQGVERELAHAATWQAVLLFGGGDGTLPDGQPLMSREELLEVFRGLKRRFPYNPHAERVRRTVVVLEQMVEEDKGHPLPTPEEIAKLPIEDQVREWIFQLRNQNGFQGTQPGWCDIFEGSGSEKDESPAHELVKIGCPAVSQLIEALENERFSRSVGFHRDFHFSHHVLRVGDCAQQILTRIAKRPFYTPATTSSYMARDERVAQTRREAERWWKEFQEKGEEQILIDGISEGKHPPRVQIERLMELRPGAVEAAVLAGAKNAGEEWPAEAYINELGKLQSERGVEFLRLQMTSAKKASMREAAARELWRRGDAAVVPALIAEWKRTPLDASEHDLRPWLQLLTASGEKAAFEALADGWERRPVDQRFRIVSMLGNVLATGRDRSVSGSVKARKPDAAALAAGEALLARALEDTEVLAGRSGTNGAFHYSDSRVSDLALFGLSRIFPERYVFSAKASRSQREIERVKAANVWRKAHGQAELSVPVLDPGEP